MQKKVAEIRYSKKAAKFIAARNPKEKERLRKIINTNLSQIPASGDIRPLEGYSDGRMRLRTGGIRIIFRYDENGDLIILFIIDIGNRGDIYK